MKVLKFGGTSVGKPERMHEVARLITKDGERKLVVLSAVSGTTNSLIEIGDLIARSAHEAAFEAINKLHESYKVFIKGLYATPQGLAEGESVVSKHFDFIRSLAEKPYTVKESKELVAEGELISTQLFFAYLQEKNISSALLPALDFMRIDADEEPVIPYAEEHLRKAIEQHPDTVLFITQGYICRNPLNEVDNLKRGGSDYTASLVGAAIRAEEVQIWTDIDGMHNNDPRIVKKTFPIAELTFDEAAELAYFGAKILHPFTIRPAKLYNIPVRLLNTMQPEAQGTLIAHHTIEKDIKAVAAKDGIIAIKIRSSRMLLAYGFLRKLFEVFEKYKTPVDMITTSEVAVSLTIDNPTHLDSIIDEISVFGNVEVDKNQTIICIVGSFGSQKQGVVAKVFDSIEHIPVRMISYGGSNYNVSILIDTRHKNEALNALNEGLF
ncbi:aspartate kinase [Rhodocytophaga aerolata]|uniref:Aspartokinase n=1 Tax=Rhodocytophaga aerolata TaxID=455078 RepID=A0ABT8R1P5_9BACT|nr:aspartate kinase [Rhodocytophaga aerolata]MDO1446012.1 aspartate kinase [Rhodocytophaga aerolata]